MASAPLPDAAPVGLLVLSDDRIVSLNPHGRSLLGCAPDADLDTCRAAAAPVLDMLASASLPFVFQLPSRPSSPPDDAPPARLHVSGDAPDGDLQILQIRDADAVERADRRRADAEFSAVMQPIYRAFAHDARNPIVASQLQLGILRELDGETLAERAPTIAHTLDRHLTTMSDGISLLVDELAPDPDEAPTDVLTVIDDVRRLTLPYAHNKSAVVEARTGSADLYTYASAEGLQQTLLGFLARLLPDADSGNRIDLRAELDPHRGDDENTPRPVITLTAHGLVPTADLATDAVNALRRDAARCGAKVEDAPMEGSTRVRLLLPFAPADG
jgi:hypothetical protein